MQNHCQSDGNYLPQFDTIVNETGVNPRLRLSAAVAAKVWRKHGAPGQPPEPDAPDEPDRSAEPERDASPKAAAAWSRVPRALDLPPMALLLFALAHRGGKPWALNRVALVKRGWISHGGFTAALRELRAQGLLTRRQTASAGGAFGFAEDVWAVPAGDFAAVPRRVIEDASLSAKSRAVFVRICQRGIVYRRDIESFLGCSRDGARAALMPLVRAGLIERRANGFDRPENRPAAKAGKTSHGGRAGFSTDGERSSAGFSTRGGNVKAGKSWNGKSWNGKSLHTRKQAPHSDFPITQPSPTRAASERKPKPAGPPAGGVCVRAGIFETATQIWHRQFAIDLGALEMQLAIADLGLPKDELSKLARNIAVANALQWDTQLAAGESKAVVLPVRIPQALRASHVRMLNEQAGHETRMERAESANWGGGRRQSSGPPEIDYEKLKREYPEEFARYQARKLDV